MTTPVRIDLHVHTVASPDSKLTVEGAVDAAIALGLDGIAVTDHNTQASIPGARRLARQKGLLFIAGIEVSTVEGHLLVYGVEEPPGSSQPMQETIRAVHAAGGIAVMAHPFRRFHGAGPSATLAGVGVDGVETLNGHTPERTNARAVGLAESLWVPTTGGSDAHRAADVGRCFTEFHVRSEDVRKLFREGRPVARGRSPRAGESARVGLGNAGKRLLRGLKPL